MSSAFRAAVIQLNSGADVSANLLQAEALIAQAAAQGAKLAVLPECFAYLGPENGKLAHAEALDAGGPILTRCKTWAKQNQLELIIGGFWERASLPNHVYNTCLHLNAAGELVAQYRKIHLFDVALPDGLVLRESETVEPGSEVVTTQTGFGKIGLSICYDVRFPELYRKLVDQGAIALAVPAAFTYTTGKEHWHILLRARAIEAQSYVLAAAQAGHHYGERRSYGHAMIINPWGQILAECDEAVGLAIAELDAAEVARVRTSFPSLAHRVLK